MYNKKNNEGMNNMEDEKKKNENTAKNKLVNNSNKVKEKSKHRRPEVAREL